MDEKYGEFIGVDSLNFALITADTEAAYTPGTPAVLAPVAEIAAKVPINKVATYYDNKAANNYVAEGPTEIKVVVSNLDAENLATILGKDYVTADGVVYDDGQANPPECALGFRYNMGTAGYRYYWYLLGTFSGGEEAAVTKKDNVDVKTYELTFTALPTTHKFLVDGENKSLKRIFGDTADANFDETGWFTTIPTPVEA
jgi:phi13 family phage major tail protein